MQPLPSARQCELNRLCIETGLILLQHGAESALVESVTRRIGLALKADRVEVAVMANALTVSTIHGEISITTVRRNQDQAVNMSILIKAQQLMLDIEAGHTDLNTAFVTLRAINPYRYPRILVAIAIGISCACFAKLANADIPGCSLTFLASGLAMVTRQKLSQFHFSPLVTFFVSAFVATSVAAQGLICHFGTTPKIAMAASCLLLVPGVPLINAVSDMVKGYLNTGIARGTMAILLALSTCGGIVLAMTMWNVWAWL
jgi:uncharacterized membrane protein YjjP (DUF1212 family)